jgi:hypothetical protein
MDCDARADLESGVKFVAVDNANATQLTIRILAAVAQEERERISNRTQAALQAKKARGALLGFANPAGQGMSAKEAARIRRNRISKTPTSSPPTRFLSSRLGSDQASCRARNSTNFRDNCFCGRNRSDRFETRLTFLPTDVENTPWWNIRQRRFARRYGDSSLICRELAPD